MVGGVDFGFGMNFGVKVEVLFVDVFVNDFF